MSRPGAPGGRSGAPGAGWDAEVLARAGLSRVREPGDAGLAQAVAACGAVETWSRIQRLFPELDPRADLERAARLGIRLVTPGTPEWPVELADLDRSGPGRGRAPLALWVRGPLRLGEVAGRAVAVVGSRAATAYGEQVAAELGCGLAERGWVVVSGAAYGVDGAAHRGALAGGGPTLAVLAGGLDIAYPAGHARLLARLAEEGAVVSEHPCGSAPTRGRFLARNRVIAALTVATVVVEAGLRSGARNTLAHARALGRQRLVVPGPVTSPLSAGCHQELRGDPDSVLVTSVAEVVEAIGRIGTDLAPQTGGPQGLRDGLDARSLGVLDAVPVRQPAGPAHICQVAGLTTTEGLPVLALLVSRGLVDQVGTGFRLAAQPSPGPAPARSGAGRPVGRA